MDEAQQPDIKRSENEEDEAIASRLAAALCEDDVEKFLQLYDEIPTGVSLERLGNIKEMARQLAALTRNTGYRYSPTQVKDSPYFGINHTLQAAPLSLNGQLGTPELSVFKTPPEGHTPVDEKHFNYEKEETLKTLQATHNFALSLYEKQLNDSGITQQDCTDSADDEVAAQCVKANDDDAFEYHTPPEFQDENIESPPFGYPPSSDKLINSVINLLSKTEDSSEDLQDDRLQESNDIQNETESCTQGHELFEESKELGEDIQGSLTKTIPTLETTITVNIEQDCFVEKDSLDGSPHSRRSFTQEEDDSGISIVDENDIVHESSMSNSGHFEVKKELEKKNEDSLLEMDKSAQNSEKMTCDDPEPELKYQTKSNDCEVRCVKSNDPESKYTKSNCYENEESTTGWQTRQKRMSKKRHDRGSERMGYRNDTNSTERLNHKDSMPRRSASKNKERNLGRSDKADTYSKVVERHVEDKYKEKNAWSNRWAEDNEVYESPKRSGRRGGQAGKKSDNTKYTRNGGNKEKYSDFEKLENQTQNTKPQPQPNVFTYRDALLKPESKVPKEQLQSQASLKADRMFNLESAVNYLSNVWTSVNNLHKKDPSKVYVYNGD